MPDRRTHRGAHPEDARLFAPEARRALEGAVRDMVWLLNRGYAEESSLKLVGDRFALTQRQRVAVMRASCSDAALSRRREHETSLRDLAGRMLLVDGYNVLTTVEAALGGGVVLLCRDGCCRDMASVHGTWRKVQETVPAVRLLGETLAALGVEECLWYLDRPVSNSGRLKRLICDSAAEGNWSWRVELVQDPDYVLARSSQVVTTADSAILDRCAHWVNLARETIGRFVPTANVVDLSLRHDEDARP